MSVNLSIGIDPKKTKHLGQNFHTIDFDFDTRLLTVGNQKFKLNPDDIQNLIYECNERWLKNEKTITINGYEIPVTKYEIERINETCETIKRVSHQRYRFFGK